MRWEKAATSSQLEYGPVLFKHSPRQIALFKAGDRVYAVDNRCPHEGYPLKEGALDEDCVLTCKWHNWKFRLSDGRCLLGGDDVRCYPVKLQRGHVWVNLEDPPREEVQERILGGLKIAFDERDYGRMCREIIRLHYNQSDPKIAIRKAIEWSHDRLEYGYDHAFAATADWLSLSLQDPGNRETELICLAEAFDHMAHSALRHRRFPFAATGERVDSDALLQSIELEDRKEAESILGNMLSSGFHWRELEELFAEAALAHYNDFGHSLIYVHKTGRLLELLGPELEASLLLPLVRHLCYTTREDLLPEFKAYSSVLAGLAEPVSTDSGEETGPSLFPATVGNAFSWLSEQSPQHSAGWLYDSLLDALARNMLHFDARFGMAYDRPVSQNIGWLDFTHGITFANAVRNICLKYPRLWPQGLLQMACFIGRNRKYLDLSLEESEWIVGDEGEFQDGVHEKVLDHGLMEPIFSAHLLKTATAVYEELQHASASCRKYLLAALNRFFNSPLKQKHTRRLARQSTELVSRDFSG